LETAQLEGKKDKGRAASGNACSAIFDTLKGKRDGIEWDGMGMTDLRCLKGKAAFYSCS
jgi:hypothetical protein